MRLADILSAERVTTSLAARGKDEALRACAALFPGRATEGVYEVLRERESLASTGVGSGVAIPHGRLASLETIEAALAICPGGVDFESVDGQPVQIFVTILAPGRKSGDHLKALARVSRVLRSAHVRDELVAAETPTRALEILLQNDR